MLSEKYLTEAKGLLSEGDLVQTSEKLWGATALTVKMVAAKRGLKLEQHGSFWDFVDRLSIESGDGEYFNFFGEANALHRNFYENEMTHTADTDVKRSRLVAPWVNIAYELALEERFEEAMTLNGFLYCAALNSDSEPMLKAG